MPRMGMDEEMIGKIKTQLKEHGNFKNLMTAPNMDKWTDKDAFDAFRAAILSEANTAIITPSSGDLPLFARRGIGKVIFQFKSFAAASSNRFIMAGLQRPDAKFLASAILMIGIGAMVYAVKSLIKGEEVSEDPEYVLDQAIINSGVIGWMAPMNDLLQAATDGNVALEFSDEDSQDSGYRSSKSMIEIIAGPVTSKTENASRIMKSISDGELSPAAIRSIRRMIPFNDLFYIRSVLDKYTQAR